MAPSKEAESWDEGWNLDDDDANEEAGLLSSEEEAIQQLRAEPIQVTSLAQQQYRCAFHFFDGTPFPRYYHFLLLDQLQVGRNQA